MFSFKSILYYAHSSMYDLSRIVLTIICFNCYYSEHFFQYIFITEPNHNYSLHTQRFFTQDWMNSFWIPLPALSCPLYRIISSLMNALGVECFCLCEISINVNKLFIVIFVFYLHCLLHVYCLIPFFILFVVACLLVYFFFILILLLYSCLFVDHVNKHHFIFRKNIYYYIRHAYIIVHYNLSVKIIDHSFHLCCGCYFCT